MTRTLATALVLLFAATAGAQADHLQCFKIKDAITKATYTANLTPTDNTFPVANGCLIRLPAKLLCVDVAKTIVPPPTPPGAGPGLQAQKYLCYKAKCPKATPTATIQDQFGTHQVTAKGTSLVCAPEPAPTSTTTTTATTSTTTTTTPGSCTMNSDCPPEANATGACQAGMCTIVCNAGFANCDANNANGCEVDLSNNPNNCGGCGFACPNRPNSNPTCNGSMCGITCNPGFLNCDANNTNGCEVNSSTDTNNCGGCGMVCAPVANGTPTCSASTCQVVCNAGFANCDLTYGNGCEINTTNNQNNCGSCGQVCSGATPNCVNSICQ